MFDKFDELHVRPKTGRTLVLGSQVYPGREDRRLRYADVVGVDMLAGPGVDRVLNFEQPLPEDLGTFSHVDCISVLEHSRAPWAIARNIELVLERGGTLLVTSPFVWRVHAYPNDYWRFTTEAIRILFPNIEFDQVVYADQKLRSEWPGDHAKYVDDYPYIPRCEVYGFGARK